MGSDPDFVQFVLEQIADDCGVTSRKMFGEYALYSGAKLFALICDDQLFVKPTAGGRAFIGDVVEAPPYPGAPPSFLIGDRIDDPAWLSELVRVTTRELPPPRPKKSPKKT
jgi:TfoX/Sxy family transcriptional regulator of competence genes